MQNIIHPKLKKSLNSWFEKKFNNLLLPFYSSIDIRNSGYKIAPIDANLFPSGFNNLNEKSKILAVKLIKKFFQKKQYKKILLIPENYTRNKMYIKNIFAIRKIFQLAGLETKIGIFYNEKFNSINSYEIIVKENFLLKTTSGFVPDVVILNRDMTKCIPDILKNLEQEIIPNPLYGWYNRQKSQFFEIYQKLAFEFCEKFQIDPWFIYAITKNFNNINFNDKSSLKTLGDKVDQLLFLIQKKYKEYKIKMQPYVFIKANNGTYGMGIITVKNGKEIINLNKKKRNKIKKIKEGVEVNNVIIQEGIPTTDIFENSPAEPLIYYIGNTPTCYLYRYNNKKDIYSNLNSNECKFYDVSNTIGNKNLLFWNIISRLAVLALTIEMEFLNI